MIVSSMQEERRGGMVEWEGLKVRGDMKRGERRRGGWWDGKLGDGWEHKERR